VNSNSGSFTSHRGVSEAGSCVLWLMQVWQSWERCATRCAAAQSLRIAVLVPHSQ